MYRGRDVIEFVDSEQDTIGILHEREDNTVRFQGTPFITRVNAAYIWPILKHFAETGELVEAPNVTTLEELSAQICKCGCKRTDHWFSHSPLTTHCSKCDCMKFKLAEAPNVIDNSILARDDAAWSDGVTDNLVEIEERLEKLDVAIDCIGRGMTALDERLKAVEPKSTKPLKPHCELVVSFAKGDNYVVLYDSKQEALEKTADIIQHLTTIDKIPVAIVYREVVYTQ